MSSAPIVLPDPFEFARRGEQIQGEIDVGDTGLFSRLTDILRPVAKGHKVHYTLTGIREDNKSFIHIEATGNLTLACQRCLESLESPVTVDSRLLLVPEGAEMPDDELQEDDFDPIHVGRDLDVLNLLEEELLLALPLAPTHTQCHVPDAERSSSDKESPFAVLGRLKQSSSSEKD